MISPPRFETLRYRDRVIEYLPEHLLRLMGDTRDAKSVEAKIRTLLSQKGLVDQLCRVRLTFFQQEMRIEVEPYRPLAKSLYLEGIRVMAASHPNPTSSARLKLLHRAAYDTLFERAMAKGFHECLLYHEGRLLECTRSNIIIERSGEIVIPRRDDFRLHGILEQKILECFPGKVREEDIPWPLHHDCHLSLTSSLKGFVPVQKPPSDNFASLLMKFWPYDGG